MGKLSIQELSIYSSLSQRVQEYINGEINYSDLKHTTALFGIYKQRGNKFMARIRVTGGEISLKQLFALSQIAEKYSVSFLHLTSRQGIQLHGIDVKNIIPIVTECAEYDMPFRGGGGNTFRNVAVCYHSGLIEDSIFDVLPYAKQLTSYVLSYNKAFDDLPRKIKFGFSCCEKDTGLAKLQDLGFIAKIQNRIEGFVVYGGGGMGNQSAVGIELIDFISADEVAKCAIAMIDLFYDHGDRSNRSKARIRFILKKYGDKKFKKLFLSYLKKVDLIENVSTTQVYSPKPETTLYNCSEIHSSIELSSTELSRYNEWKLHAIFNTQLDNIVLVKLFVSHGNLSIADLKKMIKIMSEVKVHFIRLSRGQNIYIPIKNSDVKYVFKQLNNYRQTTDFTGASLRGLLTSCIGAKTCAIGIVDTPKFSDSIAKELDVFFMNYPEFKTDFLKNIINSIKISGCQNSCSNHPAVTLGFQGIRRKNKEGTPTDYCKVFIGGQPDKLNESIDGLLLDSKQIGKYVYDLVKKYYEMKIANREICFNDMVKEISRTPLISNTT